MDQYNWVVQHLDESTFKQITFSMTRIVKKYLESIRSCINDGKMMEAADNIKELHLLFIKDIKTVDIFITMRGMSWPVRHPVVIEHTISLYRYLIEELHINARLLDLDLLLMSTVTDVRAQALYIDFLVDLSPVLYHNKNLAYALLNYVFLHEDIGRKARQGLLNLYEKQPQLVTDFQLQQILSSGLCAMIQHYRPILISMYEQSFGFKKFSVSTPESADVRHLLWWGDRFSKQLNDKYIFDSIFFDKTHIFDIDLTGALLNISGPHFSSCILRFLDVETLTKNENLDSALKLIITILKKDSNGLYRKKLMKANMKSEPDFESYLHIFRAKADSGTNDSIEDYLADLNLIGVSPPTIEIDPDDPLFAFLFGAFKSSKSKVESLQTNVKTSNSTVFLLCTIFSTMLITGYIPTSAMKSLLDYLSKTSSDSQISRELLNEFQAIAIKSLCSSTITI